MKEKVEQLKENLEDDMSFMAKEHEKTMLKFVIDYIEQDNSGTAYPTFVYVQEQEKVLVPEGYGEGVAYYSAEEDCAYYEHEDDEAINEFAEQRSDAEAVGEWKHEWKNVQPFFTMKEAEDFIERNKHNLGKTRIWTSHQYRSDEFLNILRFIFAYFGLNFDLLNMADLPKTKKEMLEQLKGASGE